MVEDESTAQPSTLRPPATSPVRVTRAQAEEACKGDFNYWARLLNPEETTSDFPDLFIVIFFMVVENIHNPKVWQRYLIAIPRGHAKTTFLQLVVCWILTFTDLASIVIICATDKLAEKILANIELMLNRRDYIKLFGDWKLERKKNTNGHKVFFHRGRRIELLAQGAGSAIRGLNPRPQFYLLDDIQIREDAKSPTKFKDLFDWATTTLIKGRDRKRCTVLCCGNKYPTEHCLISKLEALSYWTSVVLGALLSDGTALWEEVASKQELLLEYQEDLEAGVPESFVSEMLNGKTEGLGSGIRIDKIPFYTPPMAAVIGRYIIMDISTDKATIDQCVIMNFDLYADDTVVIKEVDTGKWAHDDLAERAVQSALRTQTPLICYEGVGYQHIMQKELEKTLIRYGLRDTMHIEPVMPEGESKNSRIVNYFFKPLMKGTILLSQSIRSLVINQITNFDLSRTNNLDDIIDTAGYHKRVIDDPRLRALTALPVNTIFDEEEELMETNSSRFSH